MAFEFVDVSRPEASERHQPGVNLHERLGPEPIDPPLGLDTRIHEAGIRSRRSISPTERSDDANRLRMLRRFGSAMIENDDSIDQYTYPFIYLSSHIST